ncbi:unnamed protein product [Eruca vesicaria subsp. sativa]|uniref:Uncharacterized protein n=1 Tax=Eruca vesicaria subsp. sativa TaxID=29727 RepID=A0ABC8L1D3_ERUVS|nr:unnamed protein product [Eruca vesicaria subsp. sativa]
MASYKLFLIAFLVSLSSSIMIKTCSASRHLLQQQPLPQIPNMPILTTGLPPLPSTLPQPTLPTIPTSIPPLPQPTVPTIPTSIAPFQCQLCFHFLQQSLLSSIPFFSPPPTTTTSSP